MSAGFVGGGPTTRWQPEPVPNLPALVSGAQILPYNLGLDAGRPGLSPQPAPSCFVLLPLEQRGWRGSGAVPIPKRTSVAVTTSRRQQRTQSC